MGVGFIILIFKLFFFYLVPILVYFSKATRKSIKDKILYVPVVISLLIFTLIIVDNRRTTALYDKYPQMNKITFENPVTDVRDSILELQRIMHKLPKRLDYESISYSLDKYPGRYNHFTYNRNDFGRFTDLERDDNLRRFEVADSDSTWTKYMGSHSQPFKILNQAEARRFINLIHYLDNNHLNAANVERNQISLDYNDSLRICCNVGFRTIALSDTGYFNKSFYYVMDSANSIYLLVQK